MALELLERENADPSVRAVVVIDHDCYCHVVSGELVRMLPIDENTVLIADEYGGSEELDTVTFFSTYRVSPVCPN